MSNPDVNKPPNLITIPLVRQSTPYTCGVAALQSILAYYAHSIREDLLSKEVNCTPEYGTPYRDMKRYVETKELNYDTILNMTLQQLETNIDNQIPVIVAIQAWSDKNDTKDWKDRWDDGHYVVVIGYNDENYYFMDPSTLGNYTYIEKSEFLDRWHDIDQTDDKVIHLGLVITGHPKTVYIPDLISKID